MRSHHDGCSCGGCGCHKCRPHLYEEKCAGKGTTALGVIGTVLGGAALLGEGVLGRHGFFGGRDGYGHDGHGRQDGLDHRGYMLDKCSCLVDKYELGQAERIGKLEAILEKEKAEKFALERDERLACCLEDRYGRVHEKHEVKCEKANDLAIAALEEVKCLKHTVHVTESKNAEIASIKDKLVEKEAALMDSKLNGRLEKLKAEMVGGFDLVGNKIHDTKIELRQEIDCVDKVLNDKIRLEAERRECCCKEQDMKLALEAERRECADRLETERRFNGDKELFEYVNCRFVPGKKYIPQTEVGRLVCGCGEEGSPRRGRLGRYSDDDGNIFVRGNHNTVSPTVTNTPTVSGDEDNVDTGIID